MFRHPNFKHINGTTDDISLEKRIDQSIRYFQVPAMNKKEDVLNSLLDKINAKEQFIPKRNNVVRLYYSVASVAATVLVVFALYFMFAVDTFNGVQNASNVFYLPDQSRVILTEGSQLRYSKLFFNREVKLKGEAYFEAEHEEGSSFYVKTNEGGVLVLGTRFSVSEKNNSFVVQCYEGIIGIDYHSEKIKIAEGMRFVGQHAKFDVLNNNNTGYPDYARFNFNCNNLNLSEVWPVVESYFGVSIDDRSAMKKSFTGSIVTGNVHEVIDIICTSMELDFKFGENKEVFIERR